MEEYFLLFEVLKSKEYSIRCFDDIAFVLETIWLKSYDQKVKWNKLMEIHREEIFDFAIGLRKEIEDLVEQDRISPSPDKKTKPDNQITNPVTDTDKPEISSEIQAAPNKKPDKPVVTPNIEPDPYGEVGFSFNDSKMNDIQVLELAKESRVPVPLHKSPYLFTDDYFPVKNRQLQQAWRTLKNTQAAGLSNEINFKKTIYETAKKGYFSSFQFEKKRSNQLRLFVFIDQGESMLAMEDFGKELCNTAKQSEFHTALEPYFFKQMPVLDLKKNDYFFTNENSTKQFSLKKLFLKLPRKNISVLIYSDAGALNGYPKLEEKKQTETFIKHLNQVAGYIAWINPAPKFRWTDTNAELIANNLPMFETSRSDIENAITALKGKLTVKNNTYVTV
ncbi:hypothetical protein DBR11_14400 [Pedobacter sp. HMWF019]|nr:hypothetical protein DBR11_14400 [Pedobacter sp. HMWF019]